MVLKILKTILVVTKTALYVQKLVVKIVLLELINVVEKTSKTVKEYVEQKTIQHVFCQVIKK